MAQDRFDSFDMYLYPKSGHDAGQGCKPGTPKKREKPDRPDDQGGRGGLGFVSDCKLGLMTSCLGLFDRVGFDTRIAPTVSAFFPLSSYLASLNAQCV